MKGAVRRSVGSSPTAPPGELAAKYRKMSHDPDHREADGECGVAGPLLGQAVSTSPRMASASYPKAKKTF
jgi:hypothetical protein